MALALKQTAESTSKAVGTFREAIQDLLVPELRAMKVALEASIQEMRLRNEATIQELRLRDANLREELRLQAEEARMRDATLREELRAVSERFSRDVQVLSDKLDTAIDVRERLVALEARMPRLQ